jgi:hypothetical protein
MQTATVNEPVNRPVNRSGLLRGKARMLELAREAEAARQAEAKAMTERAREDAAEAEREAAAIIADLGRAPTALERVLVTEIAALSVKARRLRSQGRPGDDVARLISRLASQLGLSRSAPRAKPQPSGQAFRDYLAAKAGSPAREGEASS